MQTIYLDISNKGVVPTIYAKQGDVGRKFEVVFTDSGIPYSIPTNAKISIWYEGDSGVGNYTDIGENSAIAIGENKAVVELITQMLSEDGEGIVCLVMNAGNNQIGSWNIRYLCERVPGFDSERSKEYYTAFSKTVESLKQVTENLTPEAIGAAPAGYGLGETSGKYCTDCNTATEVGFYALSGADCINYPSKVTNIQYGRMRVERRINYVFQEVQFSEYIARRQSSDGGASWSEWEYENPPMIPGEEYRTTERRNGKAVYTMLIDVGEMPSSSHKEFPHILGANVMVVDYTLMLYRDDYCFRDVKNTDVTIFRTIGTVFVINNIDNTESHRAYLAIKYVKN